MKKKMNRSLHAPDFHKAHEDYWAEYVGYLIYLERLGPDRKRPDEFLAFRNGEIIDRDSDEMALAKRCADKACLIVNPSLPGRDILNELVLVADGPEKIFTIE